MMRGWASDCFSGSFILSTSLPVILSLVLGAMTFGFVHCLHTLVVC